MNEWKLGKLGDVCLFQEGYVNPSQKEPSYFGSEVKWLRANDLNNSFVYDTSRKLSKKGFESAGKAAKLFKPNTIAISKSGSIGKLGMLKDYMCGNRAVINIEPKENVDSKYIFNVLKFNQENFEHMAVGSVQPNLYVSALSSLDIYLPPLLIQRAIASVLSSLDDKIDLLHRQNYTLEAMAETLFRQWFVEEVKDYWEVVKISDIAKSIQYGFTQSASLENIGPKFLRITDIQGGNVNWQSVPFCIANENEFLKYHLKTGDIVVARTGASTGENLFIYKPDNTVFASYLIRIQFPELALARYVAQHMRSTNYFDYIEGILSGSAQPNANANELTSYEISLPTKDKLDSFNKIVTDWDEKKHMNQNQIRTLTALRDTLLPKLMSGEVRVEM